MSLPYSSTFLEDSEVFGSVALTKVEPLEDEGAIAAPLLELANLSLGRMLGSVAWWYFSSM